MSCSLLGSDLRSDIKIFPDRVRLLAICRGDLSAAISWLISQCLWELGGNGREELNKKPPPSPAVLWIVMFVKENPDSNKNILIFICVYFNHLAETHFMKSTLKMFENNKIYQSKNILFWLYFLFFHIFLIFSYISYFLRALYFW